MELNFIQSNQIFDGNPAYEAEFEVTSDFNIHIERPSGGRFLVYQKTAGATEYDMVDNVGYRDYKAVIDMDMTALVYPKTIRIVSQSEPSVAVVTFNA